MGRTNSVKDINSIATRDFFGELSEEKKTEVVQRFVNMLAKIIGEREGVDITVKVMMKDEATINEERQV